jgi:hypothetical protein
MVIQKTRNFKQPQAPSVATAQLIEKVKKTSY